MKAYLYKEEETSIEPVDEHALAVADQKPDKVDPPHQGLYVVNYKTMVKPTLIALAIFAVWALATWIL